jgi:hypothetical protein
MKLEGKRQNEETMDKDQHDEVDDEETRATKKLKSQGVGTSGGSEIPAVIMTESGTVVMPKNDSVITFRDTHYEKLPHEGKDKVIAHKMQHIENEKLLFKIAEKDIQQEDGETKQEAVEKRG